MTLLLAPMEGLLDFVLRDVLTRNSKGLGQAFVGMTRREWVRE